MPEIRRIGISSESYLRLIDSIFGLTLTYGIILYKEIIQDPISTFSPKTLTLILVYNVIILSWMGYHKSISKYPYKPLIWGKIRVFLDILIVFLYAYILFNIEFLEKVILGIAIIYGFYFLGGFVRIREWGDKRVSRPILSFAFIDVYLIFYIILLYTENINDIIKSILIILNIIFLYLYRRLRKMVESPSPRNLGVDVDGVLGDQVKITLDWLHKKGEWLDVKKSDVIGWHFTHEGTDISDIIEQYLLNETFINEMPIISNSDLIMKKLAEEYHIIIATNRPKETKKYTKKWLKRYFEYHEFVNTRKIGKENLSLDILIDDNLDNIKGFSEFGGLAILFSQPWNKFYDEETKRLIKSKKIILCKNWEDIWEVLKP
ncbi:MAG: hypothetical protein ACFFG0_23635 [Candidatus Thorarchaeota archaeon]